MKYTNVFLTASFTLISFLSYSQNKEAEPNEVNITKKYSVKDYPDGFYYTLDDFINKNRKPYPLLQKRMIYRERLLPFDSDDNQIFFFTKSDTLKVTNVFAISFRGNLYIQQKHINKYTRKGDRNEEGDNPNSYHRVLKDGKFFYIEGPFANGWSKAFAYGSGGAIGGVIGSSLNHLKGVVFNFEKKEFDFFKNCDDFNLFLTEYKVDEKVDCDEYSINRVREIIAKIIQ